MIVGERLSPDALLREAASLIRLLGGVGSRHLIIVGGLVPPLLLPEAAESHIGSGDIDLCLSVAFTRGQTRDYYYSLQEVIKDYFEPAPRNRFRWVKKEDAPGLPILVDFLAAEDENWIASADGAGELEDENAAANTGGELRPFLIRCGDLIDRDAVELTLENVDLVYRPGVKADITVRHAGPVGFLAAKADALDRRDEPKDGYDVAWWCVKTASSEELAKHVTERPCFDDPFMQETIAILRKAFKSPEHVGPSGYASECHPDQSPGDDLYERARLEAFLGVSKIVELLQKSMCWDYPIIDQPRFSIARGDGGATNTIVANEQNPARRSYRSGKGGP